MIRPLSLLLAAAFAPATPALAAEGASGPIQRYALVVGANDGGSDRVALRYAWTDAEAFHDVMVDLGGVQPSNAVVVREPDVQALRQAFADLGARVDLAGDVRSEVVFYYSGHSDEQGLLLRGQHYTYGDVRRDLDSIDADVRIAVLDSCASGALIRAKGGSIAPPFLMDESRAVKGHAYLTSASADESAQEADRILGSYFTHTLVTGLRGAADTSGDSRVTLSEAYAFAYDETLSQTANTRFGPQHANHDIHLSGTGDLVLTDLSAVDAGLVLTPDLAGRLSVRDGSGRLVVEVSKGAGRPMELGLGSGRYRLVLEREDGIYEAKIWLGPGQRRQLDLSLFVRTELVATVARGGAITSDGDIRTVPVVFSVVSGGAHRDVATPLAISLVQHDIAALTGLSMSMALGMVRGDARGTQLAMGANTVGGSSSGPQFAMGANYVGRDMVGAQFSMGANIAGADARGVQATMGANIARRDAKGAQLSMGANIAGERFRGAQVSMGANLVGRDMVGTQLAMGANVVAGAVEGTQIAMGANVAGSPVHGGQISMGVNVAPPSSRGFQVSSGVNVAGNNYQGAQIGLINIGGDLKGSQIGMVNVARKVAGSQIGLLNVAKRQSGASFGLLQIVQDGQFHGEAWASDTLPANAGLQFGSKTFFTQVHAGWDPTSDLAWTGAGLGVHLQRRADPDVEDDRDGRLWAEIDVSAGSVYPRYRLTDKAVLGFARGSVGLQVAPHVSPQIGVQLGVLYDGTPNGTGVRSLAFPQGLDEGARLAVWPGVFVGVQF